MLRWSRNVKLTTKVTQLEFALDGANSKIDALKAYTKAGNLIIVGLPSICYADAASADGRDITSNADSSVATEKAVLEFCDNKLNIPITTQDISIAHRLKMSTIFTEAPPVIEIFTTREVRDAAIAVRRRLGILAADTHQRGPYEAFSWPVSPCTGLG